MLSIAIFVSIITIVQLSAQCPDGWRQSAIVSNKCYLIVTSRKIWFDASIYCRTAAPNAFLTSISSAYEQYNLNAITADTQSISSCDNLWIGANDFQQGGTFIWEDGTPFLYKNWGSGQPVLIDHCVSSQARSTGVWRVDDCGIELCFICESNSASTTPAISTQSSAIPTSSSTEPTSTQSSAIPTSSSTEPTSTQSSAIPTSSSTEQSSTSIAFDSEGTDFWTAFIANKGSTPDRKNLIFFNNKDTDSNVTIRFNNFSSPFDQNPVLTTVSITVPARTSGVSFDLPALLQFTLTGGDTEFGQISPIGIYISATSPVRVFGQSTLNDGTSGDLFTILPTSALGTSYFVALNAQPVAHPIGSSVLVIITQDNTNTSFSSLLLNAGEVFLMGSAQTGDIISKSFSADKPIAVIAGSQCFYYSASQCDYRAYMPLPTRCGNNQGYFDTHPVLNLQSESNTYILAAECGSGSFQVDGDPGSGGQLATPILNYQFDPSAINTTHVFSAGRSELPFTVTRTNPAFGGAILLPVLSTSQYVTNELVNFFVPNLVNNFVQIIADRSAQSTATLDGTLLTGLTWLAVPTTTLAYSIATVPVTSGSHTFSARGSFTITIYGYASHNYSYAYVPALNTGQLR